MSRVACRGTVEATERCTRCRAPRAPSFALRAHSAEPLRLDGLPAKRLELDDPQPALATAGAADDTAGAERDVADLGAGLEAGVAAAGVGVEVVDRLTLVPPAALIEFVARRAALDPP